MATAAAAATPATGKSTSPIVQAATTTAHCEGRQITVQILEIVDIYVALNTSKNPI